MTLSYAFATPDDLEEILAFSRPFEAAALAAFPALPRPGDAALADALTDRLASSHGIVARDGAEVVGTLLVQGPWPSFHGGAQGVFSPLASCLVAEDRDVDRLFTTMLTELGRLEPLPGVDTMALTCFAHHHDLLRSAALNGFGVRCADAVARIEDLPDLDPAFALEIRTVPWQDAVAALEPKHALADHLASSPMFMEHFDFSPEFVAWKSEQRQSVHLVAFDGERAVGFVEATGEGENYLTAHPAIRNICGAGVLPAYRGRGIMTQLVAALARHEAAEGVTTLGVDYETLNPTARGFWVRLFVPYTRSPERRFDVAWHTRDDAR